MFEGEFLVSGHWTGVSLTQKSVTVFSRQLHKYMRKITQFIHITRAFAIISLKALNHQNATKTENT